MTRSDQQRIDDIADAAREIATLASKGRETWDANHAVQLAAEPCSKSSANQLSHERRERYPDVQWHDITRLRIVLAHHYHRVDPNQVWSIAVNHVPVLLKAIEPA